MPEAPRPAGVTTGRFTGRDGVEPVYRQVGTGRPLIPLHRFTLDASEWLEHGWAVALAERGHGDSARRHDPAVATGR